VTPAARKYDIITALSYCLAVVNTITVGLLLHSYRATKLAATMAVGSARMPSCPDETHPSNARWQLLRVLACVKRTAAADVYGSTVASPYAILEMTRRKCRMWPSTLIYGCKGTRNYALSIPYAAPRRHHGWAGRALATGRALMPNRRCYAVLHNPRAGGQGAGGRSAQAVSTCPSPDHLTTRVLDWLPCNGDSESPTSESIA